jgi:predicted RNA-binding protein
MANGKVVLQLRIRHSDGKRVYITPAIKNGKIKPLAALVEGKVVRHAEGTYVLRFRDQGRGQLVPTFTACNASTKTR